MKNLFNLDDFSSEKIYEKLFATILSKDEGIDAEVLTSTSLLLISQLSKNRNSFIVSNLLSVLFKELEINDERLTQKIFGCTFKNPLGLAAGFDKNGVGAAIWDRFGFGFAELGTVTFHSQPGNPKPRLFRLSKEKAALNRMGFNNNGAQKLRETLESQNLKKTGERNALLGLNIGKSKITSLQQAPNEYLSSLEILAPLADYVVINVSSPNTPGLRELQKSTQLKRLIKCLKTQRNCPPLFIKIAPDLDIKDIIKITEVACEEKVSGIIAVNTSLSRLGLENRLISQTGLTLGEEKGGLSGAPLSNKALEIIKRLHSIAGNELALIGVGGIDSPQSAWERISAGASLIQIYTGWIYEGPGLVPQIIKGLLSQIQKHGFKNISEAIGSNEPWI